MKDPSLVRVKLVPMEDLIWHIDRSGIRQVSEGRTKRELSDELVLREHSPDTLDEVVEDDDDQIKSY